jgi:dTDP-4-dehydrorhamnose 3,5-epimerase
MKTIETALPGVMVIEPQVFGDERGFFMETFHQARYADFNIHATLVQDNLSLSQKGVLRGLHFQHPRPQGKLIQVLKGEVFDVAVDIRIGSPTFGKWVSVTLSSENRRQVYIPPDFAHGFLVTSDEALFAYKCTEYYCPETESAICWDDPEIGIDWPIENPVLSQKDSSLPRLKDIDRSRLPIYKDSPSRERQT